MDFRQTQYGVCLPGFRAAGVRRGKYGVAVIVADKICDAAIVTTKNSVKAAPVTYTKAVIGRGVQAIVANSGNANCCVAGGIDDARAMAAETAKAVGVDVKNVAVSSTGVIGKKMDIDLVKEMIKHAATSVTSSSKGSLQAAKAIMTTDKRIKMYSAEYAGIKVGGICKGSGMIAPNMATMLAYITTNADIPKQKLSQALREAADESFNMVSVEGDMSTNDTVILLTDKSRKCDLCEFKALLAHVCCELTKMIARDGEGASKFLEVIVEGAKTKKDAKKAVKAIIGSPLVKCAMYGENPNWGRIMSSMGSVIKVDYMKVDISFSSKNSKALLFSNGKAGNLEKAAHVLKNRDITVLVNLNLGKESAIGWGCDMTVDYVKINAGYN